LRGGERGEGDFCESNVAAAEARMERQLAKERAEESNAVSAIEEQTKRHEALLAQDRLTMESVGTAAHAKESRIADSVLSALRQRSGTQSGGSPADEVSGDEWSDSGNGSADEALHCSELLPVREEPVPANKFEVEMPTPMRQESERPRSQVAVTAIPPPAVRRKRPRGLLDRLL
jgi:hypothetical protein